MKGKTNNPNGRPKGKPNRITTDIRSSLSEFLNSNWNRIESDFDKATSSERLRFFEKLLPYVIPRLQTIEHRSEEEKLINALSDDQIERLYSVITKQQNENNS